MNDRVNASPSDVKKLANALQRFETTVKDSSKQAQRAIDQAHWHDRQKSDFEAKYKEFHKRMERFVGGEVNQFVKQLTALANDLERAQSRRF